MKDPRTPNTQSKRMAVPTTAPEDGNKDLRHVRGRDGQLDDLRLARQQERRRRRRRLMIQRTLLVLAVMLAVTLIGLCIGVKIHHDNKSARGESVRFLAVKEITVKGDTRYTDKEIIKASKLFEGQSLLSVNKVRAHDALLKKFPYLDTVKISNNSFYSLCIEVTEVPVMAAVEMPKDWMVLGVNNRALEKVSANKIPKGAVRIVGASLAGQKVGTNLLDERSLRICTTLIESAKKHGLKGMTTIDIRQKTRIVIMLNERMEVVLGNETNLDKQIGVLVDTLPTLYKNNGKDAAGRLSMVFYSDDDKSNDKAIYTPQEVLDKLLQEQNKPMAAVQTDESWTVINEDNVALEVVPEDQLPEGGLVRIVGATHNTAVVGKELLDVRSLRICHTLIQEAEHQDNVTIDCIDITKKTDIILHLNKGLQVKLGDSSALAEQMAALNNLLADLWKQNGEDAAGVLDMTSYSDGDDTNDKAVYTPKNP